MQIQASGLVVEVSESRPNRRGCRSQLNVRSPPPRRGHTLNPVGSWERGTTPTASFGRSFLTRAAKLAPGSPPSPHKMRRQVNQVRPRPKTTCAPARPVTRAAGPAPPSTRPNVSTSPGRCRPGLRLAASQPTGSPTARWGCPGWRRWGGGVCPPGPGTRVRSAAWSAAHC